MNTNNNETVANTTVDVKRKRMGRPRKHYWDINLVMEYIATENLQTLGEYEQWVKEQQHENIFPLHPNAYYKGQYPGVDKFLGNPEGTSKARLKTVLTSRENRVKSIEQRRLNAEERRKEAAKKLLEKMEAQKAESAKSKSVKTEETKTSINVAPNVATLHKSDVAQCFKVLLEHNVSYETLNKVNAEMSNLTTKQARDITGVLLDFLSKKTKTTV